MLATFEQLGQLAVLCCIKLVGALYIRALYIYSINYD